jgi:hypothetical protein
MRRILLASLLLALAAGTADARHRHHRGFYGFFPGYERYGAERYRSDRYGPRGDRYDNRSGAADPAFGEQYRRGEAGDRYGERYRRDDATTGFGGFDRYRNSRPGVEALVPANWQLQPPDERWNGRRFVSPDGNAWFALYAAAADKEPRDEHIKKVAFAEGEELTYLRRESDWLVVSGFTDNKRDRIFYRKAVLACDGRIWRHVALEYPADQKQAFDALVTRATRALNAGDSADCIAPARATTQQSPVGATGQPPPGATGQPPAKTD